MSTSNPEFAIEQLKRFDKEEQLAIIEALDDKRRKENYVKYWEAQPQQAPHFKEFTKELKIFGILGGNRSGKTEEGVFIDVAWALGKKYFEGEPAYEYVKDLPIPEPPNNIWIVGLDYGLLKNVIWSEKLRQGRGHPPLLPRDPDIVKRVVDGEFQVYFTNGSIITGKSADAGRDKFQGASVDLVHIDEECEADVFDECYQRTADCAGKLLLTLTPLTDVASGVKTPWVFNLYEDMLRGQKDIKFVKLNVLKNPYVPEDEKVRLIEKWKGNFEESARLFGDFIQRSGLVYPLWKRSIHVIEPKPLPRQWRRIVSIDPAATGTTAAVWAAIEPGTDDLYLYKEYYESNKIVSEHAKDILVRNGSDPIDIWLIDPKWGSQRNAETHRTGQQLYRENGIPVRLADVNYDDYGLNASREYISATLDKSSRHPKVYVFNDLKKFQWEIERYVWDYYARGDQKGLSKDKPLKRNDHLINAFQYLCCLKPRGRKTGAWLRDEASQKQAAALNSYT
jgi:phage terminase large subunit-like protein